MVAAGPDGRIEYANRRALEYFANAPGALLGTPLGHLLGMARIGTQAIDHCLSLRDRLGNDRWHLARVIPEVGADGTVVQWIATFTDVDDDVRERERLRFLNEAGTLLSSSLRVETILRKAAKLGAGAFADWCAVYTVRGDEIRLRAAARSRDSKAHDLRTLRREYAMQAIDPLRRAAQGAATIALGGFDEPHVRALVVPVKERGSVLGLVNFLRTDASCEFTSGDIALAEAFAQRVGAAMRNAERFEREHRVAMALQDALLPEFLPAMPGVRFSCAYRPSAAEALVGGDWYDAFTLNDGTIAVTIGDVTGHGLEAAAAMGKMRELFRATAIEETRPSEVMRRVNRALLLGEGGRLVTALFGIVDVERRFFAYALAGHLPPVLVREGSSRELPTNGNLPLGFDGNAAYDTYGCQLEPEDVLALYTDGLVEHSHNLIAGIRRLRDVLEDTARHAGDAPADRVVNAILRGPQRDDVALLLVSFAGKPLVHVGETYPARPESAPCARQFVQQFLTECGLDPQALFDTVTAVGEGVANAIEHAYAGTSGEFTIRAQRYASEIALEIEDNGLWRRPVQLAKPGLYAERGRGLHIMRRLTHRASIERTQRGTRVTLRVPVSR